MGGLQPSCLAKWACKDGHNRQPRWSPRTTGCAKRPCSAPWVSTYPSVLAKHPCPAAGFHHPGQTGMTATPSCTINQGYKTRLPDTHIVGRGSLTATKHACRPAPECTPDTNAAKEKGVDARPRGVGGMSPAPLAHCEMSSSLPWSPFRGPPSPCGHAHGLPHPPSSCRVVLPSWHVDT